MDSDGDGFGVERLLINFSVKLIVRKFFNFGVFEYWLVVGIFIFCLWVNLVSYRWGCGIKIRSVFIYGC